MADSDYGTPFDSTGLSEERKRKLREEIKKSVFETISGQNNVAIGVCSLYSPRDVNPFQPVSTCASINKNVCVPISVCGAVSFTQPKVTSSELFDQLAAENKKLTQEKIKLNLKVLELQKENYNLTQDNNKYKAFAEAEKGKVWKDLNKNIKSIYQKTIDWFNS
jgi:hypothetical protein